MKIFTFVLLLLPTLLIAQDKPRTGYGYLAMGGVSYPKYNSSQVYPSFGVGLTGKSGKAGIGVAAYFSNRKYLSLHWDMRVFTKSVSQSGMFFSVQPGILLVSNSVGTGSAAVSSKGSFALNASVGLMTKSSNKKPGMMFAIGYSQYSISTKYQFSSSVFTNRGVFALVGIKI